MSTLASNPRIKKMIHSISEIWFIIILSIPAWSMTSYLIVKEFDNFTFTLTLFFTIAIGLLIKQIFQKTGWISSLLGFLLSLASLYTIWALIIPNYLVSAFNVILVKNYYQNSVPDSLIEAAQLDGASELKIFFKVMLPLAVPTVATISLFTGICYWNDWTNGLYYISNEKLYSIQQLLMKIMNNIQAMRSSSNAALIGTGAIDLPGTSIRMAMAVIGILPIMLIYPFVQKYLVKGVVVGAVKG